MSPSQPRGGFVDVPYEQANRVVAKTVREWGEILDLQGKPKSTPCSSCVHRCSNANGVTAHGKRWDTAYTAETRDTFWTGDHDPEHPERSLRGGATNPCHQTQDRPCAGAVVLQQRELIRFCRSRRWLPDLTGKYDLTPDGVIRIWRRMFNGGERSDADPHDRWRLIGADLLRRAHPAINDPDIGHEALEPPQPGEFEE
jgi:hypothetical protein